MDTDCCGICCCCFACFGLAASAFRYVPFHSAFKIFGCNCCRPKNASASDDEDYDDDDDEITFPASHNHGHNAQFTPDGQRIHAPPVRSMPMAMTAHAHTHNSNPNPGSESRLQPMTALAHAHAEDDESSRWNPYAAPPPLPMLPRLLNPHPNSNANPNLNPFTTSADNLNVGSGSGAGESGLGHRNEPSFSSRSSHLEAAGISHGRTPSNDLDPDGFPRIATIYIFGTQTDPRKTNNSGLMQQSRFKVSHG
ncbi:hypothetical protein C8R46DRAFT_1041259 [Mycena filopes]|nr:hypothetical protein C8R46DRAFT_1041259 [Mycena filopes]